MELLANPPTSIKLNPLKKSESSRNKTETEAKIFMSLWEEIHENLEANYQCKEEKEDSSSGLDVSEKEINKCNGGQEALSSITQSMLLP